MAISTFESSPSLRYLWQSTFNARWFSAGICLERPSQFNQREETNKTTFIFSSVAIKARCIKLVIPNEKETHLSWMCFSFNSSHFIFPWTRTHKCIYIRTYTKRNIVQLLTVLSGMWTCTVREAYCITWRMRQENVCAKSCLAIWIVWRTELVKSFNREPYNAGPVLHREFLVHSFCKL